MSEGQYSTVKAGFIGKQPDSGTGWKKRYLVLTHEILAYYKKQTDAKPVRIIQMRDAQIRHAPVSETKKALTFCVYTSNHNFFFASATQDDYDEWMAAFQSVKKRIGYNSANRMGSSLSSSSFDNNFNNSNNNNNSSSSFSSSHVKHHLPVIWAVLQETLRIHPPAPSVFKASPSDRHVSLGGYDIPAHVVIYLFFYYLLL
eukprot:gb/GECH01001389.1/.p1 GENE.gb/GECH01001389.1/~~gb/GECH01001389.1/.p1  ORF type:complete len:201 (+),score=66.67 gb/GECH01001389.1/:1-603(+)